MDIGPRSESEPEGGKRILLGRWLAAAPQRGRALYEGVQAPGALSFKFFKNLPGFPSQNLKLFKNKYYARIAKSPLIHALIIYSLNFNFPPCQPQVEVRLVTGSLRYEPPSDPLKLTPTSVFPALWASPGSTK